MSCDMSQNLEGNSVASSQPSMASTFKGRNTAKSSDELKQARESRAAEALRMKDEQLRILAEQNASLLASLDKVVNKCDALSFTNTLFIKG